MIVGVIVPAEQGIEDRDLVKNRDDWVIFVRLDRLSPPTMTVEPSGMVTLLCTGILLDARRDAGVALPGRVKLLRLTWYSSCK